MTKKLLLGIFALCGIMNAQGQITVSNTTICEGDSVTLSVGTNQLATTFAAGNNHRGNMFDIVALNEVTITSFDAHPQANTTVEVYYKIGLVEEAKSAAKILGYNYNSSEWYSKSYKLLNKSYKIPKKAEQKVDRGLIKKTIKKILN